MQQMINHAIFLSCALCLSNVYAIQPIEDDHLALAAGENTLILDAELVNRKKFIVEQDQALMELPAYQSLLLLNLRYHTSLARLIGEQIESFTQYFGLEPLSYQWYGNHQDILEINRFSNVTFDHQSGSYELNNARGKVWIDVETHRK